MQSQQDSFIQCCITQGTELLFVILLSIHLLVQCDGIHLEKKLAISPPRQSFHETEKHNTRL